MSTVTLPVELVPVVRNNLYYELGEALDDACRVYTSRDPESVRTSLPEPLDRADAIRAVLDVVGWTAPAEPAPVTVEMCDALTRATTQRSWPNREGGA